MFIIKMNPSENRGISSDQRSRSSSIGSRSTTPPHTPVTPITPWSGAETPPKNNNDRWDLSSIGSVSEPFTPITPFTPPLSDSTESDNDESGDQRCKTPEKP